MSKLMTGEYHYNGFIYKVNKGNSWSIIKDNQIEPTSLFKYYANNNNGRDAISNGYFFLSHPFHLNDYMDCSQEILDFSKLKYNQYKSYFRNELKRDIPENILEHNFQNDSKNDFVDIKSLFWSYESKKFGVLSLSERHLNPLMWSHYSQETGFMIEIDKAKFIQLLINPSFETKNSWLSNFAIAPVNYVEKLEQIPVFREKEWNNPTIPFMYMTNVKTKEWKYEKEWR
jgi:hypothetical protein